MSKQEIGFHEVWAVKYQGNVVHWPHQPELAYDPSIRVAELPPLASVTVDILAPKEARLERLGWKAYREWGYNVCGAGSHVGEAFFADHSDLGLFYPDLVPRLGRFMPIHEFEVRVTSFQGRKAVKAHPEIETIEDAQNYLIATLRDWGGKVGILVTSLDLPQRRGK